jgi:phosphohistidine phosphatase SixA
MQIFLLRTSLTEPSAPFLSLEGRRLVRALGNKLRLTEDVTVDRVMTSPAASAIQTAELFADRLDYVGVVEVMAALGTNVPPEIVAPQVLSRGERIALVADEPALSALGAFLIGRPTFPPLVHAQVSVIQDRQPAWTMRATELTRGLLLVA